MKESKNEKERNVDSLGTHSMRMKMNFRKFEYKDT